jgi:hypothetical protein
MVKRISVSSSSCCEFTRDVEVWVIFLLKFVNISNENRLLALDKTEIFNVMNTISFYHLLEKKEAL